MYDVNYYLSSTLSDSDSFVGPFIDLPPSTIRSQRTAATMVTTHSTAASVTSTQRSTRGG